MKMTKTKKKILSAMLCFAMVLCLTLGVLSMPTKTFATGTSYAITNGTPESVKETNHGYIAIDKATAAEGETVTITVNPATGYQLKSLTVTPAFTVTFDLNGVTGTAPTAQTIEKDGKVTKPTDPTDTIHTFAGWYKTKDATTGSLSDPWDFDNGTVIANMTLYAKWTRTLGSIYGTNENIPKADNNTAPDNAWVNDDGGKAFIAFSGRTSEVLYFYKKLEPSGAKQLSCRKTENFTKIGDDYVFDYYLSSNFYGKYTLHMTDGKFTSVTYDGAGTDYEELSGTYTAPANKLLKSPAPKLLKSSAPVDPETITPAKQTDGTYQFTMPAYAVTVTAEFEEVPTPQYKYTTYENWQIKYGNEWTWSDNMTKIEDGLYQIEILWEGTGFNVKSDENPIKKDWYDKTDPDVTFGEEVIAPVIVDVYLRVINDETLKIGVGEAPTITHNIVEVSGTPATESTDGFEDAYKCVDCNQYFEDEEGTLLIGDEAAYNAWKLDEGKIDKLGHDIIKVDGAIATTENDGFKDAYKCNNCDQYFEDEEATKLIGDEAAYEAWKLNAGKIDKLEPTDPSENNKGKGGLVVLIIVIILVVLLGAYACGYFFLYRKGKLDNSGIKVIYSFLPKSKEEK